MVSVEKYVVVAFSDLPPLRTLDEAIADAVLSGGTRRSASVLKVVDVDNLIPIGSIVEHIVGAPGPDYDLAIVTGYHDVGQYKIRFKVWGKGDWIDGASSWGVRLVPQSHKRYYDYYNEYVEEAKKFVK